LFDEGDEMEQDKQVHVVAVMVLDMTEKLSWVR